MEMDKSFLIETDFIYMGFYELGGFGSETPINSKVEANHELKSYLKIQDEDLITEVSLSGRR